MASLAPILLNRRLHIGLTLAWMALIFYLSSQSTLPIPFVFSQQDKVLHAGAYGALSLFITLALGADGRRLALWQVLFATLLVVAYGASDEFHQSFVPGRTPDIWDLLADTVGGFSCAAVFRLIYNRFITA